MARRIFLLLAAIGALATVVATPQVASGEVAAEAQNRVWAAGQASETLAEGRTVDSPCKHQGSAASSGEIASAYLVAAKGGRTAVIGRDMKRRVIPYAERHGYDYYRGTPRFVPFRFERLDLWFNKRWINKRMRQGDEIVDIGEPPGMPPSRFYDMERGATSGYPRYREDPQP